MKRFAVALSVLVAWTVSPVKALPSEWPRLTHGSETAPCADIIQIARATFQSNSFNLFPPPIIPDGIGIALVLEPKALEISGGNALKIDAAVFDKLPIQGESEATRNIYWERKSNHGVRLVVQEKVFNWQGDMYALFALQEAVKPDAFLAALKSNRKGSPFEPIVDDGWRPPLIFQEKRSRHTLAVDVGPPYAILSNWEVYVAGADGVKKRCTVQFRPNVRNVASLLPQPVRRLANLLDQTMGPGANEGTLQSTARLRLAVKHTWASAALRPWALPKPYNSREQVNNGLRVWSGGGPTYRKTYNEIQRQYPVAQQALAKYYEKHFRYSPTEGMSLSDHVLDIALRSHYTFHNE